MKLVYIAGPYRHKTKIGIEDNILRAREAAVAVWKTGAAALCPHLNSAHFDGIVPDSHFLDAGLLMLRHCDAVLVIGSWEASAGTGAEIHEAYSSGIPVFESVEMLRFWLEELTCKA